MKRRRATQLTAGGVSERSESSIDRFGIVEHGRHVWGEQYDVGSLTVPLVVFPANTAANAVRSVTISLLAALAGLWLGRAL